MPKPNYAFAKRQRDLSKKQRKEEKQRRKMANQQAAVAEEPPPATETDATAPGGKGPESAGP
jgi:hypothetical protein